jgi:hypothetical protein
MIDNEKPGPIIYPKIVVTNRTLPRVAPQVVAEALGAEATGEVSHANNPIGRALSAARYGVARATNSNIIDPPVQE